MKGKIGIIILAAGSSTRMGQSKQLLPFEGETLLQRAALTALNVPDANVVVVVGSNDDVHRKLIETLPLEIIHNVNWQHGIGSSLKSGLIHTLKKKPDIDAVIFMVCDQPRVTSSHLQKLVDAFHASGKPIVASSYANTAGIPVLFSPAAFSEIFQIRDDHGAKKIILRDPGRVRLVELEGGEIDIDTMDDYQRLK